jgi:HSP20 family protein
MSKTTDVFVVTNGTSTNGFTLTTSNSNNLFSTGTGNNQYLLGTTTGGFATSNTFANYPTYNDFWKFDEEFDLLWKSFFSNDGYKPIREKVAGIPCDIQETDNGLRIELAAVGLEKSDIDIIVDSETLRVAYRKNDKEEEADKNEYRYLLRTIKKSSFDLAWKISSKYNLQELEAKLDKGLLTLDIPFAKENKPTKVTIK